MSIPINIDALIKNNVVESTRIEYKADFNPEPIIRAICAFANDIDNMGGGYIIVGIDEKDGVPSFPLKGIAPERLDGIMKKLRELCHHIEPLYEPVVEPIIYHDQTDNQDKHLLIIWVAGGYGRPYKAPKDILSKGSPKYYYIRKFSSSVIPSRDEEKELFYVSSNIPFDDRPNLLAEVEDLDLNLMREHLKETKSDLYQYSLKMNLLELAKDMQLVSGPPEDLRPLNVGLLMFCAQPEKYFRYARIEIVDIPDPTGTNMTERIFTGPIQYQLRSALNFLKGYALQEVIIKEKDKAEATRIYNYPYTALEELLANAVYHRSYQVNEPITVRITPEAIEITSFPGFDRSISDEDIANYDIRARIYRNRRIGDYLKELRLIEGRNTGFPNAYQALRKNGSAMPVFKMNLARDFLSVTIPVHPYFLKGKLNDKNTMYREKIYALLQDTPMSVTELALAMGYKGITKKLTTNVDILITERKITKILAENRTIKLKAL